MNTLKIQSLFGKGKSEVAANLKIKFSDHSENEQLKLLLDNLLSPANDIDDEEVIDWLVHLLAGGATPEDFCSTVRTYDKATTCGLVWTENFVAYRCRTCGISPCMSLCTECFHHGDHEGHDFILFRSETGGTCDCGDGIVCNSVCSLHGPRGSRSDSSSSNEQSAPAELLCIASGMMPRLFYRLILNMKEEDRKRRERPIKSKPIKTCKHNIENNNDTANGSLTRGHKFIKMLQSLADMGIAMRKVMIHCLTKPHFYHSLQQITGQNDQHQCKTFLEELVFWTVKFEFPEDLICLLLSMRSDFTYKEEFTRAFILHYQLISETILHSTDPEKLCKHVAAVSVQLFSIEQLAIKMVDQMNLLPLLVTTLQEMINNAIVISRDKSFQKTIDCDHDIMKLNLYWPIKSDLKELLSHQQVATKFFGDDELLGRWIKFLSHFQGMNLSTYIEKGMPHLEQETDLHIGTFTAELELSATPMWTLLSHLKDPSTAPLTQRVIEHCLHHLMEWSNSAAINKGQVSFHFPLHRNLSMFIKQGLFHQNLTLRDMFPSKKYFPIIGLQLIRLQSTFHQILGRQWSRNGAEIVNQAESYVNSLCCNSMIDADIFLLQSIAGSLPRDQFLSMVFDEFGVYNCLGLNSLEDLDTEEQNTMLEGFLVFLATLTSSRVNLGMEDEKLMALEMSTLLCKGDKLHSELMELLPERCGTDSQLKNFEKVLCQIAEYQAPRQLLQGKYVPKPVIWETFYDPIHTILRSTNRAEFQESISRYQEFIKRSNLCPSSTNLWPPFRIPIDDPGPIPDPKLLLSSNLMIEVIFVILYRAVHMGNVPNFTVALSIYLLELAVSTRVFSEETTLLKVQSILLLYPNADFGSNLLKKVNISTCGYQHETNRFLPEESIISLLLQLYTQFKDNAGGYVLQQPDENENRVGDGAYFVGNLLNKLAANFPSIRALINLETSQLDPTGEKNMEKEREDRRRKAKERKLQIMTELAMKRQQFMKMNEDANSEFEETPIVSETLVESEFQCVICMEKGGSKFENPYGLITYLMPSSVLAHRKSREVYGSLEKSNKSFKHFWESRCDKLKEHFDNSSIQLSFPLHCGNGVNIQTCGHYLHTDCFNSYMNSLKKSRSHLNQRDVVQLNHKKFSCPLCRQLGNSFLPIIKDSLGTTFSEGESPDENELTRALKKRSTLVLSPKQKQGVEKFLEDLQKVVAFTKNVSESECSGSSPSAVTVCAAQSLSLVFLNALELESIKCTNLPELQRSYLLPLYSVLRYSYKSLSTGHSKRISQYWETVTGVKPSGTATSKGQRDVPLLMKDVNVLLSHLTLQLPYGTEVKYINVLGEKLLFVKLVQTVTALCCQVDSDDLNQIKNGILQPTTGISQVLYKIVEFLAKHKSDDFELTESASKLSPSVISSLLTNVPELEAFVSNRLRSFVKKLQELNSVMLRDSRSEGPSSTSTNMPSASQIHLDFNRLITFPSIEKSINIWLEELVQFKNAFQELSLQHLIIWDGPKLIDIPNDYDRIFQGYRKLQCDNCNSVPSEPALCLLCGKIVCLNSFCCLDKQSKISEVIQHSTECGMGSAVYLCVLSSAILVVVGKEACVWGSIFLDSYGEMDLDLKRGKPLFLCKERFQFLQKQWKTQSFHKYELKWFPHDNML